MKPMVAKYAISGARDKEERLYFESISLDIYNESATMSDIYYAGFNALMDALQQGHSEIRFEESREPSTEMDPLYDQAADIFSRGIYEKIGKREKYVRNGRYLQLDGIDAVRIAKDWSHFTIYGEVKDL